MDPHPLRTPTTRGSEADAAAGDRAGLSEAHHRLLLRIAGVGGFVLLTGLAAQVEIRFGRYEIPLSFQTLAVVLSALCLGPRFGLISMLVYYVIGLLGVPLFAHGASGVGAVMGQTGGYLLGFIVCQPVLTRAVVRADGRVRGWLGFLLGLLVGQLLIFAIGVPWLYYSRKFWLADGPIPWSAAMREGFVIFIPWMLLKTGVALMIGMRAAPWAMKKLW